MNASVRPDRAFYALSGSGLGWTRDAGGPNSTPVDGPPPGNVFKPENPETYATALKVSDNVCDLKNVQISQCAENAVDVNNRATAYLHGEFGTTNCPFGDQIFSVKGRSFAKISGILRGQGHRLKADIILDNWSDQSFDGSTIDIKRLYHETNRKIRVVKRLDTGEVIGEHELLFWQSLGLTIYWWTKWCVRKILRIPVGKKGPSWL